MEDEIQKRNTDCVYFLASPLTCKKGSECEFRHSERARLNPRECYYWLNGSCINPNCAFRHPPLDGFTKPGSEAVPHSSNAAIPTSKSSVPCYFYFNAYCIKGDHCPFLHNILPAQENLKASQVATAHPPEKKASTGSDTGPASVEVPVNLPGSTSEAIKQKDFKEVSQQPTTEPSPSAGSSVPEFEVHHTGLSDENPLPPTEYGSPQLGLDQGPEELAKECAEPDEWWESSPGFDVLVDDGSDHLPYDDDADHMQARERESGILNEHGHLLQYHYKVPAGYDPYLDDGYMYEHGMYDSYNCVQNSRYTPEFFQREQSRDRSYSRERSFEAVPRRKRISSRRRNDAVHKRDTVDLRDHLRNLRRTDGISRKRKCSRSRCSSREQSVRHGMGPLLHGRLGSEVGDMDFSADDTKFAMNDSHAGNWPGYHQSKSRLRERESRRRNRRHPPEGPVRITLREESSEAKDAAATFTGPKTLAQIKEEKRRAAVAEGNISKNYDPRHSTRSGPKDSEGPKPLKELLNYTGRSAIAIGRTSDLACLVTKEENHENQSTRYESDFVDDDDNFDDDDDNDDDDDDSLRKKLAHILSP